LPATPRAKLGDRQPSDLSADNTLTTCAAGSCEELQTNQKKSFERWKFASGTSSYEENRLIFLRIAIGPLNTQFGFTSMAA